MNYFTALLFVVYSGFTLTAQNIYPELNYKFSLFKKGVKNVNIIQADVLKEVWKVNAENKTITIYTMKAKGDFSDYTFDEENMPTYNDTYFIAAEATWYFQKKGRLDSVVSTVNRIAFFGDHEKNGPYGDEMVGKVAQTHSKSLYCYSKKCLASVQNWYSDEIFTGVKVTTTYNCQKKKSTKFTVNNVANKNELIYDDYGRLAQIKYGETTTTHFEYDQEGNLKRRYTGSNETTFTYNTEGLIASETKSEGRPMPYEYTYK